MKNNKSSNKEQPLIEFYSIPESGHAIPLLHIIQILQQSNPTYKLVFHTSHFWIAKMKDLYPHINMFSINDKVKQQTHSKLMQEGPAVLRDYIFKMHQQHFQQKTNKPDLIVCDIFSGEAIKYAVKNQVKFVLNCSMPYAFLEHYFSFPSLKRSFAVGGHTVLSPPSMPVPLQKIFMDHHKTFRYKARIFVNTSFGLQPPSVLPAHHTLTGFLSHRSIKKGNVEDSLKNWMKNMKKAGKKKFVYIYLGSSLKISKSFAEKLLEAIEESECPAIWSSKQNIREMLNSSKLIFHKSWFPQEQILLMPQVAAFISHCGWGSTTEAIASQTPLVCFPTMGDQLYNAELVHAKKIGIQVYDPQQYKVKQEFDPKIEVKALVTAIIQVKDNQIYKENISQMNKLCSIRGPSHVVSESISESLQFGNEHLIDPKYEQITERTKSMTVKIVMLILFFFSSFMFFGRK